MTLQTFADNSTENFVSVHKVGMSGRRWDTQSFGQLVI